MLTTYGFFRKFYISDYFALLVLCTPSCLNGGTCQYRMFSPNVCNCPTGFQGADCGTVGCTTVTCLNGGTCSAPETCTCQSGYEGVNCSQTVCVSGCSNGGVCVGANLCSCPAGLWSGPTCDTAVCPAGCVHGSCNAPTICTCDPGWVGVDCNTCKLLTSHFSFVEITISLFQSHATRHAKTMALALDQTNALVLGFGKGPPVIRLVIVIGSVKMEEFAV